MPRAIVVVLSVILLCASPVLAQTAKVDGEWNVQLTLPLGETWFSMWVVQKGGELSGHMLNDTGQYDMKGTINRDQVKIEWEFPDGGSLITITFTGKVDKNTMSGSAKVGNVGQGTMAAQRKP